MRIKKLTSMLMIMVMLTTILVCSPSNANALEYKEFIYEKLDDNNVVITEYIGFADFLEIPKQIKKYNVLGIGQKAFINADVKEIVIPEGVTYIEESAFENCVGLSAISLPDTLVYIDKNAFYNTAYYNNENNWENGALYIDNCLIKYTDTEAIEYTVNEGTYLIAGGCFYKAKNLEKCQLPNTLQVIGKSCFSGSSLAGKLILPDSLLYIDEGAFYECYRIIEVSLPESLVAIGARAFSRTSIREITIPESVTIISVGLFEKCNQLKKVQLSKGTVIIQDHAFYSSGLETINFPDSLEYMGQSAFRSTNLSEIKLPENYTVFYESTFEYTDYYSDEKNWYKNALYLGDYLIYVDTDGLSTLNIREGTKYIAYGLCNRGSNISKIIIPNTMKIIGNDTFIDFRYLKSIQIPPSVERIGGYSFGLASYSDDYYRYNNFKVVGYPNTVAQRYAEACGHKFVDGSKATSVKFEYSTLKMGKGETANLEAVVSPRISALNCKWKSSNKEVVKVTQKGKLTALKTGKATITITSKNGKTAKCKVTVYKKPKSIKFSKSRLTLLFNESYILQAIPDKGAYVSDHNLKWSIDNKDAVRIKPLGNGRVKVYGRMQGLTATLKVETDTGKTAYCKIAVKTYPQELKLNEEKITLKVGESCWLNVLKGGKDTFLGHNEMEWKIGNKKIVSITKIKNTKVKIKALKKGQTVIKADLYGAKAGKCTIVVK